MKWYLKLDPNNIIQDVINYQHDGYIEVDLPDTSFPAGINGGWYKWNGTTYEEVPGLKPADPSDLQAQIAQLQQQLVDQQTNMDQAIAELTLLIASVATPTA